MASRQNTPAGLPPPHRVAVLAYDGLCTFEFGCAVEIFALERPELGVPWYTMGVCAERRGWLRAAGGVQVSVRHGLALLDRADTIVIPGWSGIEVPVPPLLARKLRAAHRRGARLCTICSGVFVLAATGLLDGHAATTHWRYAEALARRFPSIEVRPQALYVEADEGRIVTSAGSAAGLDMLLHLVRRDHGATVANRVAQRLVIPPHRLGDQAQFVPRPMPPAAVQAAAAAGDDSARLARLLDWTRGHLAQPHTLESLARRAAMSPRTLQRHFQASLGLTPLQWLVRERVAFARELLESRGARRLSMARVAERAGLGSEESLRRHFRLVAGVSPSAYRAQFAAGARRPKLGAVAG